MKRALSVCSMAVRSPGWAVQDGPESAFYVDDGAIVAHESSGYPTSLRSARQYENFEFRGDFFVKGWMNSGIYLHAPEHGRNMWCGMKINIFHQVDEHPAPESMGSIFPLVPPLKVNVKNKGEWNTLPHCDGLAAAAGMDQRRAGAGPGRGDRAGAAPPAAHGVPGARIALLSDPFPQSARARTAVESGVDAAVRSRAIFRSGTSPTASPTSRRSAAVLHSDGLGHLATQRAVPRFRIADVHPARVASQRRSAVPHGGKGRRADRHYEIQLHDVEGAHYPTGSLYSVKRGALSADRSRKVVAVAIAREGREMPGTDQWRNGPRLRPAGQSGTPGLIELQAHDAGRWTEYKEMQIRRL